MALRDLVSSRILNDILGPLQRKGEWKVLVLDHMSTRIISSCCRMSDIMERGITLVEALEKEREPLTHLEAVYIMLPTEQTITKLIADFNRPSEPKNMYKFVHVFFLQRCLQSLFEQLGRNLVSSRIKTLQEVNLAFLPYESRVFTLDFPDAFEDYYCQVNLRKDELLNIFADQLATVCAMLGEYPALRAWKDGQGRCSELAHKIQERLDIFKGSNPDLGKGPKQTSEFIIFDRGFDVVSPVLHELTFQCMVYDLLKPDSDIYQFKSTGGDGQIRQKQVILDENDELWKEMRHLHIADASRKVSSAVQEFAKKKKLGTAGSELSVKDLARHIRRAPQYQKELSQYSLHLGLVDACMEQYKKGINNLCKVEQDLATGIDKDGAPVDEPLKIIMSSLFDRNVSVYDKIRLLILYILQKNGVVLDDFTKMVQHSEIPGAERTTILNLMHLGVPIVTGENVKTGKTLTRKEREEETYVDSRWNPLLRDIAEYAAEGRLDESYCPYMKGKPRAPSTVVTSMGGSTGASSVRKRYDWIPKGDQKETKLPGASAAVASAGPRKDSPTIFIFVIGGITYSEMRTMYQVAEQFKNFDFVIGSTHIITPTQFLGQVKKLPTFMRI